MVKSEQKKVLVAEDDPDIRRLIAYSLEFAGFRVIQVQDGEDAVNAAIKELPDVILLDVRNRVLQIHEVYRGSVSASQVRVGELFKEAIRRNAVNLIVVHNHPSGDPTPSPEDVALTRAIVQAGQLLDVTVLDHLIIGQGRYVSLKERGLGFSEVK